MKQQTVTFVYKGSRHTFTFTPKEEDEWQSFKSHGITFDVHYCEDYKHIVVYEVIDGKSITDKTIFMKHLTPKKQKL